MRLFYLLASLLFVVAGSAQAADRFVAENAGAYSSVAAAVSAALSGDRIIILPKADPTDPWDLTGTVVNNKHLTFMSNTAGDRVLVTGTMSWTVSLGSEDRLTFTGIHFKKTTTQIENLFSSMTISGGIIPKVRFLNCQIECRVAGSARVDLTISNSDILINKISTSPLTCFLTRSMIVSGCTITIPNTTSDVILFEPGLGSSAHDSLIFVGNKIYAEGDYFNIILATTRYNKIFNNLFAVTGTSSSNRCISLSTLIGGDAYINNNTYTGPATCEFVRVLFDEYPFAVFEAKNNVDATGATWHFSGGTPLANTVNVKYNYRKTAGLYNSVYNHATNVVSAGVVVDQFNNFQNDFSSPAVNGGDPGKEYLDLDLTRNDAGIWGGPYSWTNFGPKTPSANPDIFYIAVPKRVQAGGTLQLKGFANSR